MRFIAAPATQFESQGKEQGAPAPAISAGGRGQDGDAGPDVHSFQHGRVVVEASVASPKTSSNSTNVRSVRKQNSVGVSSKSELGVPISGPRCVRSTRPDPAADRVRTCAATGLGAGKSDDRANPSSGGGAAPREPQGGPACGAFPICRVLLTLTRRAALAHDISVKYHGFAASYCRPGCVPIVGQMFRAVSTRFVLGVFFAVCILKSRGGLTLSDPGTTNTQNK